MEEENAQEEIESIQKSNKTNALEYLEVKVESWYAVGYFLPTLTGSTGLTVELSRVYLSGLYASLCITVLYPGFFNHCYRGREAWRCGMLPNIKKSYGG